MGLEQIKQSLVAHRRRAAIDENCRTVYNGGGNNSGHGGNNGGRRSHCVVKVDKCTGEEHVFRIRSQGGRVVRV